MKIKEVENQKISHAQMFLGDPGLGALPLAIAFAQYILCEDKQENDSCGVCPTCRQVQELQHPDLHFSFPTIQSIIKVSNGLFAVLNNSILFSFDFHTRSTFLYQ